MSGPDDALETLGFIVCIGVIAALVLCVALL